jgi:hypothetical protein
LRYSNPKRKLWIDDHFGKGKGEKSKPPPDLNLITINNLEEIGG